MAALPGAGRRRRAPPAARVRRALASCAACVLRCACGRALSAHGRSAGPRLPPPVHHHHLAAAEAAAARARQPPPRVRAVARAAGQRGRAACGARRRGAACGAQRLRGGRPLGRGRGYHAWHGGCAAAARPRRVQHPAQGAHAQARGAVGACFCACKRVDAQALPRTQTSNHMHADAHVSTCVMPACQRERMGSGSAARPGRRGPGGYGAGVVARPREGVVVETPGLKGSLFEGVIVEIGGGDGGSFEGSF
eukprot:350460-Chlamydomonas_euryale.AAC.5